MIIRKEVPTIDTPKWRNKKPPLISDLEEPVQREYRLAKLRDSARVCVVQRGSISLIRSITSYSTGSGHHHMDNPKLRMDI